MSEEMTGAEMVVRALKGSDGKLTAVYLTVGKDGFVPQG